VSGRGASTITERVAAAREQLRDAGLSVAEAEIGARVLAQHLLGWSTEQLLTGAREAEPPDFGARFDAAVARRAAREPLAYIVGQREFWGLALEVTPDVLIPRPETELIVETALDLHPDRHGPLTVADICTGSGCVAIAMAHERPAWSILATDISDAALTVARRNAARHAVDARVRFARADLLEHVDGPFDLIVANPPYVRAGDRQGLQPEVREEPEVALFGGADGVEVIARIAAQAPSRLKPGAYFIFEFGLGQDIEVEEIVEASGGLLTLIELKRDLQGIARTAVTRRR
jgi:release factor glutamine methyltransferase